MDLTITQLILSRLCTNSLLRKRFLANPETVGKEYGLDEQQIREFSQLAPRQLNFFADSLIRKRLGEVRKLLPLTGQALGTRFDRLFCWFAEGHPLAMPQPHKKDAIAFCGFLKKSVRSELSETPWASDVAAFEAASLEATVPGRRWTVRLFRYSIKELAQDLASKEMVLSPDPRFCLAVWFRIVQQGKLRLFTLALPRLLWFGDGPDVEPIRFTYLLDHPGSRVNHSCALQACPSSSIGPSVGLGGKNRPDMASDPESSELARNKSEVECGF